ncbi:MAG: hypothetical protein PUE67_06565 [Oscillospiraceae bacterium]|nr:hypothetical protein [Oscillospiraceae bacterium]
MRRTKRTGNFFLCLLINILLNLEGSIPAWILLFLHFFIGISILWFWLALAIWIIYILVWMKIIGWAGKCSKPDPPKENKNPYSSGKMK